MPRAIFKGSLSFGLVNIPIKVYNATRDRSISFHMIHSECQTPLKYKRWCPKCERDVSWGEIEHGYPITEHEMVVIKKEELEALRLKTTRTIEIKGFVDLMAIDPIYFASHYYIVPQEGGEKAYSLLRDALSIEGKAAVGKVVLHNKEHIVSIRPYRRGLLMDTLNYADEILNIEKLEELERLPEIGEQERKLATALVESMSGDFKPEEYKDTYRQAVMQLIKQKAKGVVAPVVKPVEVRTTVNIMKALEESIKAAKEKKSVPA